MPKSILVGMYNPDGPADIAEDDWQMRLQELRIRMTQTFGLNLPQSYPPPAAPSAAAAAAPAPAPALAAPASPELRVFLAPEYFFRKNFARSEAAGVTTAYTEQEFLDLKAELQRFSKAYPNFLLIGGSIFWRPTVLKPRKKIPLPIRHSVVVAHNGVLLLEYEKRNDCVELRKFEIDLGYQWTPGTVHGSFTCDGLQCGIETCIDHDKGQLMADGGAHLDLHIVISNTVSIKTANVAAAGQGFLLHCNAGKAAGKWSGNNVYHAPFGMNDRVAASTAAGPCRLFRLQLP